MKLLLGACAATLLGGGGFAAHHYGLFGAGISSERSYLLPASTAFERLEVMQPSSRLVGLIDMGSALGGSVETDVAAPNLVRFVFKANGHAFGTYTATVTATGPVESLVTTDLTMASDADRTLQGVIGNMAAQFARVGREVMDESVDAALDGRPVDDLVFQRAQARYALANQAEVTGYIVGEMARAGSILDEGKAGRDADERDRAEREARRRQDALADDMGVSFRPGQPMAKATPSR